MQFLSVIRRRTEKFSEQEFEVLLEPEAQAVRTLYAQGIVRAIWSRDDTLGAVTLIEADSIEHARSVIDGFPLAQHGMLEVEALIPLRGYRGFGPR